MPCYQPKLFRSFNLGYSKRQNALITASRSTSLRHISRWSVVIIMSACRFGRQQQSQTQTSTDISILLKQDINSVRLRWLCAYCFLC